MGTSTGARDRRPARWSEASASELMPTVYEQLRSLAASYLGRDSPDLILEPAVLAQIPAGRPVSVERETFPR